MRDELKINQPQASDGWLTQDALWLVSKTVSDKLRAYLLTQGIDGIPANNTAVFNVLQDHGIAQPAADGKAIWKATVTSDAGWSHDFTFLKLSPAVIWSGDERPEPFAGTVKADEGTTEAPSSPATAAPASSVPSSPVADAVSDLLSMMGGVTDPEPEADQDTSTAVEEPTAPDPISSDQTQALVEDDTPSGEHFLRWLGHSIRARRLIINDAKALVHTVAGTVYLVSPGVFQRYVQEHPGVAVLAKLERMPDWQWVQKSFERIHAHRKQPSGLNIWTCEVQGPRKTRRIHGYLLNDPDLVIARPFADNPYLTLIDESSPPAKSADLAREEPN